MRMLYVPRPFTSSVWWSASRRCPGAVVLAVLALGFCANCTGVVETNLAGEERLGEAKGGSTDRPPLGGRGGAETRACSEVTAGPSPLRRLTQLEYEHTVKDLLDEERDPQQEFPQDQRAGPFASNVSEVPSESIIGLYQVAAESLSQKAAPRLWQSSGCKAADSECIDELIGGLAERAFRRPLLAGEKDTYLDLFEHGSRTRGAEAGLRLALQALLQSPYFLYHMPLDSGAGSIGAPVKLAGHALAERLSYFLWQTMPDVELEAAAAQGKLADRRELEAQVRRMVSSPRAHLALANLIEQWLSIDELERTSVDPKQFPAFGSGSKAGLRRETRDFVSHVLSEEEGSLTKLFTAPYTIYNGSLQTFYGVTGEEGLRVDLNPSQRHGILTQPSVLTVTHGAVLRGKLIRTRLLCEEIPPPPPSTDTTLPEAKPGQTPRERLLAHVADPACKNCHRLMDPLGFAFDHFDDIGRWRDKYGEDQDIDATGELILPEQTVKFDGAIDFIDQLTNDEAFTSCVGRQLVRAALARVELEADECLIGRIATLAQGSEASLLEMMSEIALSQEFASVAVQR